MRVWRQPEQRGKCLMSKETQHKIFVACNQIREMLMKKNMAYGDSALNPIRIFSRCDAVEQLKVRIDDKINRMKKGSEYQGDDTIDDLIGYLILLKIAKNE